MVGFMKRYFVTADTRRTARNGKDFCVITLRSPSGEVTTAKNWDGTIPPLKGKVIEAVLENQPYRGQDSWIMKKWCISANQDWEWIPPESVFSKPRDHKWYQNRLKKLIDDVSDTDLKNILETLIVKYWDDFIFCPAASAIHNAYIGGLLLHTVQVALLGRHLFDTYSRFFPVLRRDLIITACLLHDWGKMFEYEHAPDSPELGERTEAMALTGHISLCVQAIARLYPGEDNLPPIIRDLIHCIQSHHLILEWGSPTTPALPEAMLVAYADNTDGRLQTAIDLIRNNPDDKMIRNYWDGSTVINRFNADNS